MSTPGTTFLTDQLELLEDRRLLAQVDSTRRKRSSSPAKSTWSTTVLRKLYVNHSIAATDVVDYRSVADGAVPLVNVDDETARSR
ncbi:hypothetical protein NZK35_02545 [Stieleria sp. ICT_E10.1]|uniref:hypothetical protein n=1 Tax=Stieleria sedimenti TaxID=2976331 RepID=UPI00217F866F|nr:hypothetical protein [Stieleria sedimenti]MCS7465548.1 hypothetical protein [Stieleria sedimenti]